MQNDGCKGSQWIWYLTQTLKNNKNVSCPEVGIDIAPQKLARLFFMKIIMLHSDLSYPFPCHYSPEPAT